MTIFIARNGQQQGPYTWEQIGALLARGELAVSDLYWTEGMPNWVPLSYRGGGAALPTGLPFGVQTIRYGGFWMRAVAALMDLIVYYLIMWPIESRFFPGPSIDLDMLINPDLFAKYLKEALPVAAMSGLVGVFVYWLYCAALESSRVQGTLGKLVLGLIVTDEQGRRISFARATARYFASILSKMIFGIGFLMCIWDPRKQCLHDKIARTLVRLK